MPGIKRKRVFAPRSRKRSKAARKMPVVLLKRTRRIRRGPPQPSARKSGIVRDKRIVTLRYFVAGFHSHTSMGQQVTTVMRANGPFDPEYSVGGHQPRGWDQYTALYNKHVVLSSKIYVTCYKNGTSHPAVLNITTAKDGVTNNLSNADFYESAPRTTRSGFAQGGAPPIRVSAGVNIAKFLNRSGGIQDDDDLVALNGALPTQEVLYHINSKGVDSGDIIGDLKLLILVTYRIMFLDPIKFGQS